MKNRGVNLIRKDVELKYSVKTEKDWYILFNILIISLVISLSVVTHLFRLNVESDLNAKKEDLRTKVNVNLNNQNTKVLKSRINLLQDKYVIYQDFLGQNMDLNKIHDKILGLYPNIKIEKIVVDPNSDLVDISIQLEEKGYSDLPEFLNILSTDVALKDSTIKTIGFRTDKNNGSASQVLVDHLSEQDKFVTSINISVSKQALLDGVSVR